MTYLLDTSFLIALGEELEKGAPGAALSTLAKLPGRARLFISPVTVTELLEGAEDLNETLHLLTGYQHTVIAMGTARRCALNQSRAARRMGENDAWQAAVAVIGGHTLIACDHAFEGRSWLNYLDFAKSEKR